MDTHRHHRPPNRPAYFLGRPASLWIGALSTRERTKRR
jgi:hypothetical protein